MESDFLLHYRFCERINTSTCREVICPAGGAIRLTITKAVRWVRCGAGDAALGNSGRLYGLLRIGGLLSVHTCFRRIVVTLTSPAVFLTIAKVPIATWNAA